jgi:hypothetical protein
MVFHPLLDRRYCVYTFLFIFHLENCSYETNRGSRRMVPAIELKLVRERFFHLVHIT